MRTYKTLDSDQKLSAFGHHLRERGIATLAVDFEGEFNLHVYGEKLCLVQIFDGEDFSIIDPFKVSTEALKFFLEDRKILKLFFGAGSDVQLVYKESKIVLNSVLDLQILAEVAGCANKGLSGLNEELFGTVTAKKKHFQMHDWTRRPIDPEAVDYALSDVESLYQMHRELSRRILEQGKVEEMVRALVLKTPSPFSKGVAGIYKTEEFKALGKEAKERFEQVLAVRDKFARELNCPPDQVIAKAVVFQLAAKKLAPDDLPRQSRLPPAAHSRLIAALKELALA